jgi:DNA-binding MarR family transcriptional regulator
MTNRLDLIHELEQTFRQLLRQLRREFSATWGDRLTGAEFGVLWQLYVKSPQIVSALSQECGVSVSHITHVADQLEKKNLAVRRRSQADKRVVEIHITEEGKRVAQELGERKNEFIRQKFSPLSTEELEILLRLLQKLM